MGDIDPRTYLDAARSYERLRRLMLCFSLVSMISFLLFFLALAMNLEPLAAALFVVLIPISCMFGLGAFLASFDLRDFRCPRCGERFAVSWWSSWPTNRCKHCRLDLGAAAMEKGKSNSAWDSLE